MYGQLQRSGTKIEEILEIANSFNVGDKMKVALRKGKRDNPIFSKGEIIGKYKNFILIQFEFERKCFTYVDLYFHLVKYVFI